MTILKKFVIYQFNSISVNQYTDVETLQEVSFSDYRQNEFNSEDEAVQALVDDKKTYEDFIILKKVIIKK